MRRPGELGLAALLLALSLPVAAQSACRQTVDSTGGTNSHIDDFTEHRYSAASTVFGAFADCVLTRIFPGPIRSLKVTIVSGQADDIGYIGSTLVTTVPSPCQDVGQVLGPIDVTNQVSIQRNTATMLLRAQDLCCCGVGWGNAPVWLPAKLHWEVTLGGEPNSAHMTIAGAGSQATISVGQCVTLELQVRFAGYNQYLDVTHDPNTGFFTDPNGGEVTGNVFCAPAADANKTLTVYGRYRDPVSHVSATGTVIIHVRP
jgi:hypothetical protein